MDIDDWPGVTGLRGALQRVLAAEFTRLRAQIVQAGLVPDGPQMHEFAGLTAEDGGLDVLMHTTRSDGRVLAWLVEVWIFNHGSPDWYAIVKGEIDLDDDDGEDRCVLNEQRRADDPAQADAFIRELGTTVAAYPIEQLLTMPWSGVE